MLHVLSNISGTLKSPIFASTSTDLLHRKWVVLVIMVFIF